VNPIFSLWNGKEKLKNNNNKTKRRSETRKNVRVIDWPVEWFFFLLLLLLLLWGGVGKRERTVVLHFSHHCATDKHGQEVQNVLCLGLQFTTRKKKTRENNIVSVCPKRREGKKSGRVKMPTLIASPTPGANPQCTLTPLLLLLLQSSSIRTVLYTYTNSCVRGRPLVNCWQHSLLSSLSSPYTYKYRPVPHTHTHSHAAVQQNPQSLPWTEPPSPTYKLHPRGTYVNSVHN